MVRTPYVDNNGLKKGAWCPEEDEKLRAYIQKYGHWNWRELPKFAGLARCGKSCRLRWMNYLRPNVRHGNYSKEEEDLIVKLHEQLGNRWSKIAVKLPGRTDNEIKNHWHTHLKKLSKQHQAKNKKGRNRKCKEKSKPQEESNGNINNNTTKPYPLVPILESCPIFPSSPQLSSTTTIEPYSSSPLDFGLNSCLDLGYNLDLGLSSGSDSSTSSCLEDATMNSWDTFVDLVDSSFWTEPFILDLDDNQDQEHEVLLDPNFWTDPFFDLENYENDKSSSFLDARVSYPYLDDMDFSYQLAQGIMLQDDGSVTCNNW